MAKIIETNLYFNNDNVLIDFQSRVIEVDSWDSYVDEMKKGESVNRNSYLGSMIGESFPRYGSNIEDFKCDDYHLSFSFNNGLGWKMKKLAYLIR